MPVSILVIMEINDLDFLKNLIFLFLFVSILVIMEINDLDLAELFGTSRMTSFNPCYNGN